MRLSADAKAYAAHVVIGEHVITTEEIRQKLREMLAEAFQGGMDHIKASQRRLEKLAKGKT
jgi:hypothetical protein